MPKFNQTIITEDVYYSQQSTEEDRNHGTERNDARSKARWKAVIIQIDH